MAVNPLFFNSSKEEGHAHILYMSPDQTGITSKHGDHYHQGLVEQDAEGNIVVDSSGKPSMILGPAIDIEGNIVDGHTHEVGERVKTVTPNATQSKELARDALAHWEANRSYNQNYRKKARRSEDMVIPDKQWAKELKSDLSKGRKAALSVPHLTTSLMTLVGIYMSQATDIAVDPMESSDVDIAGPVNALFKYVLYKNKTQFHGRKAFEDQLVTGIGSLQARIDRVDSADGDIKIERVPWTDIDYGPHQLEDQSDMQSLTVSKFLAVSQLKDMYPDKINDFVVLTNTYKREEELESSSIVQEPSVTVSSRKSVYKVDEDIEMLRVIENHKIKRVRTPLLTDTDGVVHNLSLFSGAAVNKIATIPGLRVEKVIRKAIHITTAVGDVLLDTSVSKHSDFTIVASYGIKRGKDTVSFIDMLTDQQKAINRHTSLMEHYGNTMLGSHFQIAEGAVHNIEEVKSMLASPGGVIQYDPDKAPRGIERIDPPQPPQALLTLIEQSQQKMMQVASLQGFQPSDGTTSGILETTRRRQALVSHEYQFSNMRLAMERLGKSILEMMDELYFKNPQRGARILLNSSVVQKDSDFDPTAYTEEQLIELLQRIDIAEFDLMVSESPHSKTQRETDLMLVLEFLQRGAVDPNVASALLMNLSGLSSITKLTSEISQSKDEAQANKASTDDKQLVASFGDDQTKLALMNQYNMIPQNEPEVLSEGEEPPPAQQP